jgi:hypothetical protein
VRFAWAAEVLMLLGIMFAIPFVPHWQAPARTLLRCAAQEGEAAAAGGEVKRFSDEKSGWIRRWQT